MLIKLIVNQTQHQIEVSPDEKLSTTLRRLGYLSVKEGCDTGNCGACTIHRNGQAVLSCMIFSVTAEGQQLTTLEGAGPEAQQIGHLLVDEGAEQCGYCSAGLIMNILYLKSLESNPTEASIRRHLNGNLCRCTGYEGQLRAIRRYFEVIAHENR